MSSSLPSISLVGATLGTQKTLDFTAYVKQTGVKPGDTNKAHIRVYNESGCGLIATFNNSARGEFVPAGAWPVFDLEYNDANIVFTVTYTLPNPPVSSINAIYYFPGEVVPETPQLGNSPISIGGNVNVSSVSTLSNEGRAANTLVIDMGDTAFADIVAIYNDGHALWAVDQSGTKHNIFNIQTSGEPLQVGQINDTVRFLGQVQGNQFIQASSGFVTPNNVAYWTFDANLTSRAILYEDASNNVLLRGAGNAVILFTDGSSTEWGRVYSNGFQIPNAKGYYALDTDGATQRKLLECDTLGNTKMHASSTGHIQFNDSVNTLWFDMSSGTFICEQKGNGIQWYNGNFFPEVSFFTGGGSGTFNHSFNGSGESISPFFVIPMCTVASSSQTMGYDSVTTSQVHITAGGGLAFKALCV